MKHLQEGLRVGRKPVQASLHRLRQELQALVAPRLRVPAAAVPEGVGVALKAKLSRN